MPLGLEKALMRVLPYQFQKGGEGGGGGGGVGGGGGGGGEGGGGVAGGGGGGGGGGLGWLGWVVKAEQCCAIHCYSNPSCIEYFSPLCQTQTINHAGTQEVCLQGKTLKLTLNPEFDFTNSSYMCHLQYKQPKLLYTVKTWLSINGTWRIGPTVYNVRLSTPDYHDRQRGKETTEEQLHRRKRAVLLQHMHGILRLWSRSIRIEHKLSHRFRTDAILNREPVPGQMLLYSLKSFDDFGTKAVEVHRHRDEKYVTVQFTKPFLYSTDNWGNQSCHVNISDLHHSQPIYNEKNRMIVRLASPISRNEDESFSYVLDDAKENTHINVSWDPGTDASFLRSALCDQEMPLSFKSSEIFSLHKPGSIVDQSELYTTVNKVKTQTAARTERCDYREAWSITLNGWVTKKPAYLHITVFATRSIHSSASFPAWWTTKKRLLLEEDIILLPAIDEVEQLQRSNKFSTGRTSFTLRFVAQLRLSTILTDQLQHIHIVLRDCQRTRRARVTLQIDRKLQCNTTIGNLSTVAELKPVHLFFTLRMIKTDKFHAPFILSCILTVSAHIVLLIVYSFGRICARTNRVRNDESSMRSTGETHLGNIYYSTNLLSSASGFSSHRPVHMTGTRKALLMIYLCFRVFYTFLFTTSVGLALLLSTESNAAREFTAVIHNKLSQARTSESHQKPAEQTLNSKYHAITSYQMERQQLGTNHWVAEVMKMEQFAHSELTKQLKMIDAQLSECNEHKRSSHLKIIRLIQRSKKLGKEWMNPARETVNLMHAINLSESDTDEQSPRGLKSHNLTWTSDPLELKFPSLQGSTWKFLEQFQWSPYLDTVDEHLRKIRDDLDTHVIDCWAPFDRLLNRLLENSWITPARRAMNATWLHVNNLATISAAGDPRLSGALDNTVYANREEQSSRSPPEQRQRIEAKSLKLARFLGVPQPEQARLTGARIWNNFRRLVLPLPNRFHYDVSQLYLGGSRLSELTPVATPFYDHRYFFSTDDRQHIYGGNLEEFRFEAPRSRRTRPYRYATQIGMRLRPSSTSSAIYLLSLTQVRLLLLALDAFIILTRCIRTYRLTQRVWYGKVKKLYLDQIQSSPLTSLPKKLNDFSLLMGDLPGFTDDTTGEQLSGPYFNHANIPKIESHPTLHMLSPTNLAPHSSVTSMRQCSRYHQLQPCLMDQAERFDSPRLCVRSADIASEANAGPGRLTACYCCLDDHYILIVLGLGLLLVGLFIVWAADRHIRPGSILVRTGVHPRTQALEECHHRTSAILQALHPVYWNRRSLKDHHRIVDKENKRVEQTLNRLHHEQVQLYELYLAELCTLHSGPKHQSNVPGVTGKAQFDRIREPISSDSSAELMRVSAGSPCILFDQSMRFTAQFRRALLRQMNYMDSDSAISWLPVCLFSPLTVSAQTQDQSKRFLSNTGLGGISLGQDTVYARNETAPAKSTHADLAASIGSLATMVYACHRLILTGLTIALTASGLISLLHLIKLMIRHTASLRIKKIVLIIPYPVHTRPSPEDAVQLSPFDRSMGRRVTQQVR
ncbi:unnamed protein product [Dicrocoelium dendriticum]|nr:unnamed protein product [Dicrocoelium dendriticum]